MVVIDHEQEAMSAFYEEADELLNDIELTLLEIEADPDSKELIDKLFRAVHTIKGSGAMLGFDKIAAFTHHVESLIDAVRAGEVPVSKLLINQVLLARDHINNMMVAEKGEEAVDDAAEIISGLRALLGNDPDMLVAPPRSSDTKSDSGRDVSYRITFIPEEGIFMRGLDPLMILLELEDHGKAIVTPITESLPVLENMAPEKCYIGYNILLETNADIDIIKDVFIFVEEDSIVEVELIDSSLGDTGATRLGDILVDRGEVKEEEVNQVLAQDQKTGEKLINAGLATESQVAAALQEQKLLRERKKVRESATIRVAADKLDFLINVVGELVTAQARLTDTAVSIGSMQLNATVEEIERLVTELRDNVLGIRMIPIGNTFNKFNRLVRDLSMGMGKDIELVVKGGETELDKTMIEKIHDPLVHLVRNSIDHGIETPEERRVSGKDATGTVVLQAAHVGGSVMITISDDGRGIDYEKVARKAVAKGLVREADLEGMSREDILTFIFLPGFSTAEIVSDVSGRGVGMDVVRTEISKLRGRIEIDSVPGKGTKISIRLPLTMAIIDGLLVRAQDTKYIIPINRIRQCVELTSDIISMAHGRHILQVQEEIVPYVRLREIFNGCARNDKEIEQIIIVEYEESAAGLVIDQIYGDHQTVIKSLGKCYEHVHGIAGATVLGDGSVALILDVPQLVKSAIDDEVEALEHHRGRQEAAGS